MLKRDQNNCINEMSTVIMPKTQNKLQLECRIKKKPNNNEQTRVMCFKSKAKDTLRLDCRLKIPNMAHHNYKKNIATTGCLVIMYPA